MREQYWKYSLITIIIVTGLILFRESIPFLSGIMGAFTIYILLRRQMLYLTEQKGIRPGIVALLLLVETFLLVLIPVGLVAWLLVSKLQHIDLAPAMIIEAGQHVADLVHQKIGYNILDRENLMKVASYLPRVGQYLMGSISGLAVNLVVLSFILYFMLLSGRQMETYLYAILPFSDKNKKTVLKEIDVIVSSNAIGIPLLAIIQGVIALIGYFIFKVPEPFIFGFITCIATVIPVVGTALVWFPLVAYLALTGDWMSAVGLAIYALLVISNVDNLIRFMLQKKLADTHPLITIFGVVIGLSLFGFMGIIFGPLLISVFLLCVNIFKEEYIDDKRS